MGLEIIRNDAKELTKGEKRVLAKIMNLYKTESRDVYLYIQPTVGDLVPDFILIDSKKGVSIIEVKDWELGYIRDVDKRTIILQDREDINPINKTQKYLNITKGIIACSKEDMNFIEDYIYARTLLINIRSQEVTASKLKIALNQPPVKYITSDDFAKLMINDFFEEDEISICEEEMIKLRTTFFPESKIHKVINGKINSEMEVQVATLDKEQENFAKKIPYGHYMVTGVPGSGKTIILLARALHLVNEHPDWKVAILAYNKSLANKIEEKLQVVANEYSNNQFLENIAIQNIEVRTFHSVAKNIAQVSKPYNMANNQWWDEVLPQAALENATSMYDAILIDEYQDFRDTWIRVCIALCKEYKYDTSSQKDVKGVNLFMAGDRLQSIYNSKEHNWNDFGINMRGRSKLLKTSYRTGKNSVELALRFLMSDKSLAQEVKKFYKEENEEQVEIKNIDRNNRIIFVEGKYGELAKKMNELLKDYKYRAEDILIICQSNSGCEALRKAMPNVLREMMVIIKDQPKQEGIALTTYHSAKGLEAKVAILVDVNEFTTQLDKQEEIKKRKLLYVGMTRAAEVLVMHAASTAKKSFYSELKEIYEGND